MEVIIGFAILGFLGYAGAKAVRRLASRSYEGLRQRRQRAAGQTEQRRRRLAEQTRQQAQRKEVAWHARKLQVALLQLGRCPDFRRAASWAAQAGAVPSAFRQRQFHRFRRQLVEHFANRLTQGADAEGLMESLTELVESLGVAAFEADYIRVEAESRTPDARHQPQANFRDQLQQLQRDHEQRMAAIRSLTVSDEGIREQLLEAELNRFRDQLLRRSETHANDRPLI